MKKTNNLIAVFFVFFLVMFFNVSYCEANSNLSVNDFIELMNKYGSDIAISEIPQNIKTIILDEYPVIIKSYDSNKIFIYPTKTIQSDFSSSYDGFKSWSFYLTGSGVNQEYYFNIMPKYTTNMGYINGSSRYSGFAYYYDIDKKTFNTIEWVNVAQGYNFNALTVGSKFGYKNILGELNFNSISRLKSFLNDNLIFSGVDKIYYGSNDVFYRFNGVFKGNDYYKPISSEFTINTSMLKFEYEAFKGYSDEYVTINGFYLQQFTPNSAVKIDDTYFTLEDLSEQDTLRVQTGRKAQFNFLGLKNLMEKGYIYRLVAHSKASKNDVSGETDSYSTSCFFSLDSWKSTAIEVININKFLNAESSEIEIIPSDDDNKSEDNISSIIDSIDNVNKNIENTILGTPNESGERQGGLVGNLLEGLWKGLVALIIPDADTFGKWITDQTYKLSNNSGFLTYSKTFWVSMLNLITNAEEKDFILVLPAFKLPTGISSVTIWEEQRLNLTAYFKNNENETIKSFYTIYIVLVSGISIYMFCQYLWSLWDSIITGVSTITPQDDGAIDTLETEDLNTGEHTVTYSGRSGHRRYRLKETLTPKKKRH